MTNFAPAFRKTMGAFLFGALDEWLSQRSAKPSTAVRIRQAPLKKEREFKKKESIAVLSFLVRIRQAPLKKEREFKKKESIAVLSFLFSRKTD